MRPSATFNAAIAVGGLLGAFVFTTQGVTSIPWWGAAIVVAGLAWVVATDRARLRLRAPGS